MTEVRRRKLRSVARHALVLSAIYLVIFWTVFFHEGAEAGTGRFWPPASVYSSFQGAGWTGLFAFPLFLFAYAFPVLGIFDLARVWRKENARSMGESA